MFIFLSYVYMHVSVCVVMCTCEYGYSWSLEERVGAAGVPGDCKLPCRCWELNSSPLKSSMHF